MGGMGGCNTSFWHLRRRFSVDVDVAGLGGGIVRFVDMEDSEYEDGCCGV